MSLTLLLLSIVYSNGEWSVTDMWNNELIANHSIGLTLLDKLREGTISVGTTNELNAN